MKTINKLKKMMMAAIAIVCGMTLNSCGDDDDDDTLQNKVARVELHATCSMSQDLADILSVRIDGKSSQSGSLKTNSMTVGTEKKEVTLLTANTFPAQFSTTAYVSKKRNAPIKDKYEISYHFQFQLVTYYTDGSFEVTPTLDDGLSFEYTTSVTATYEGKSQENVDLIANTYEETIKELLEYTCNLAQKKFEGRNTVVATK